MSGWRWLPAALAVLLATPVIAAPDEGRLLEYEHFGAANLPEQRLTIWLPPGYDRHPDQRYGVVYMHDGHNLFDPAKSNFNKVWAADKAMLAAARSAKIAPRIIVGIWPPGKDRYRTYLPASAYLLATDAIGAKMDEMAEGPVASGAYLDWIADELRPWIDRSFRTLSGPANTAMIGSSMGGLMSCHAFVERPLIFGQAGCVSTHWPLIDPDAADAVLDEVIALDQRWFVVRLGEPGGRRLWMDHGTATLDARYPRYQAAIDTAVAAQGWQRGTDFDSKVYPGAEHEENAWATRLPEIFAFLFAGQKIQ